jgi:hypothetical protein
MSDAEREIPTLPACRTSGGLAVLRVNCGRWHWHGGCDNTFCDTSIWCFKASLRRPSKRGAARSLGGALPRSRAPYDQGFTTCKRSENSLRRSKAASC